jgi:hypothetical protein
MSWREHIQKINNPTDVNDFYTIDHHLISFNKFGALCFNRGGMWHHNDEQEYRYKRVDLEIIREKINTASLQPVIISCRSFSVPNWRFLEYLDELGLLEKITYLAYSDAQVSLPIKYIQKMQSLQTLIIDTRKTRFFNKPTSAEQSIYEKDLADLVSQLPIPLETLFIDFELFNGSLANLPAGLRILCINSYHFTGSLDYLPMNLEVLLLLHLNYYIADILNLPVGLKMLGLNFADGSYKGSITLPPELEYLQFNIKNEQGFLAAIGENCEHLARLKSLVVASNIWTKLLMLKDKYPALNNVKLTNAGRIHHTRLIDELLC